MQLAYLAVTLTIFAGAKPEMQVVPEGLHTEQAQCEQWKSDMESMEFRTTDASGRPVTARQYICQLVDLDGLQKMIDLAR